MLLLLLLVKGVEIDVGEEPVIDLRIRSLFVENRCTSFFFMFKCNSIIASSPVTVLYSFNFLWKPFKWLYCLPARFFGHTSKVLPKE